MNNNFTNEEMQLASIVLNPNNGEVLALTGDDMFLSLNDMTNESGEPIETANVPEMIFKIKSNVELKKVLSHTEQHFSFSTTSE